MEIITRQETRILDLTLDGFSNEEIGATLFISPFTVKRHKANMMAKMGIRGKAEFKKFIFKTAKMVLENHKNGT